ncbi:hypothetical protein F511_23621 [Dorcoceras hygrometricum]|uniref:CASP-like protein n=1 Tax=Dorcoceras hygrometricum TaxID=472368 RepID=A0A2Z7CJC6_9LAMI|nr:hypothetical protein F511_23621 [Dorcoceras hygrometricum]
MSETTQRAPVTAALAETPASIEGQTQPQLASTVSMPRVVNLIMRLITLASLIVSLSVMASNSEEISSRTTIHFNDLYSYRYVVATCVIGIVYTLQQLSLAIYEVGSGKKIPYPQFLLIFAFIGDKVILCLLATGAGAGFGATLDLKSKIDELDDALEAAGFGVPSLRAKLDDFLNRAYIPAIFLMFAFLTCAVSSVLSSLALTKKTQ